ncbi:YbaK/EbsC family protein [Salinisphaera sp.]|uniref:YbaK/EbsC family protein n=1 Tax=Salinisphaera sp. TaxID=1914330 RepID=UPI002D76F747|nr:YbaK/EbsC family protein [Salinisphaera sp.]HET7314300.1 YbaK/EbsC family protein [Salinisphaera sp.]
MELSRRARQFQTLLIEKGFDFRVRELPDSTRSADEAAAALGCHRAQIVKSLIFHDTRTDAAVLVLASGDNRVDEAVLAAHVGGPIEKADAAFVKETTGFSIGGVPPLGHREIPAVWVDAGLLQHAILWAAAGTPRAVFRIDRPITEILAAHRVIELR